MGLGGAVAEVLPSPPKPPVQFGLDGAVRWPRRAKTPKIFDASTCWRESHLTALPDWVERGAGVDLNQPAVLQR